MIIVALCGLGFLILVHEFGHFIVAKIFGIKVEAFSIGFGPVLFKFRWGETEYRISLLLPLGGYVKLYGETSHTAEQVGENDTRAMVNRPLWQQISVVFAGVFMNFVFGILFCVIVFMVGLNMSAPIVGDINPDGLEINSPLAVGDTIIAVNGKKVRYLEEYLMFVITEKKPLKIQVKDKNNQEYEFTIRESNGKSGVSRYLKPIVDEILPDSPMQNWGFKKNDVILKVNNHDIKTWQEFINHLSANYDKEVIVTVHRNITSENNTNADECTSKSCKIIDLKFVVNSKNIIYGFDSRKFLSTRVCKVKKYSTAETLGINKNDKIIAINDIKVTTWFDLNTTLWAKRKENTLKLHIQDINGNERIATTKNIHTNHGKPFLGITPCSEDLNTNTFIALPESFRKNGINPGDKLLEINNKKIENISELLQITAKEEKSITLKIQTQNNESKEVNIKLEKLPIINESILGALPQVYTATIKYPLSEAIIKGYKQALEFMRITYLSIILLIKKEVSPKDIAGPVGIIHISAKVIQKGLVDFLYLLALISLNLAVLNLLPIPVLDGSLILMFVIEKILGRKLPERLVKAFEITGYCLLLGLLLFALKNDIFRIIKQ